MCEEKCTPDQRISEYPFKYQVASLSEDIKKTKQNKTLVGLVSIENLKGIIILEFLSHSD